MATVRLCIGVIRMPTGKTLIKEVFMKTGLIVLIAALIMVVGGFIFTMVNVEACLEVKEVQQPEKIGGCPTYLPEIMRVDDEFWG